MPDLRDQIEGAIKALSGKSLRSSTIGLLQTLGYSSDRTIDLGSSKPKTFLEFIQTNSGENTFIQSKALFDQWKSADLLFQLTDNELSSQKSLFQETDVQAGLMRSYLFFAIELTGDNYARGKLTDIARQINRVFPMPVMVLIKHKTAKQDVLSVAVINRRQNKIDASKDVLGKVTIIRDISIDDPHRGHLDILASFALETLREQSREPIENFDTLHAAWEEIFNVELLNQRFYQELANWYFWALPQVEFPDDVEKDKEKRNATSLIRLLTRLIFCWFMKEKGLIPGSLFDPHELKKLLVDLDPDSHTFHQGILQNLFFGTLNQQMGKNPKTKKPYRQFAKDEGFKKNRSTYDVNNLYRYEALFNDPEQAIEQFADIPFLNGGLFECLDRSEEKTNKKLYIDGFSRNHKKRPKVPNHLFFSEPIRGVDLSDAYGVRSRRNETVRGLIRILNGYKFTIVENTPIDQEIALDPELLGKVFENLLASYNEETKTTARKQTGSFYTPRPIVEYMVDESLKAHLQTALIESGMSEHVVVEGLQTLFAYTEEPHPFNESQTDTLLEAIHTCKILDPACGSGAFPMGVLQKLVFIIHKLDPGNEKWMQLQIDAASQIPDSSSRDIAIAAIEKDFRDNDDDYGRKLYLIENCLYGVDIQPIAIQISKLRFFISLICDQRTNRNKRDNHGIRPLPNLETKFVAADTLIALEKDAQLELFESESIYRLEQELQRVRHDHFAVTTRQKKLVLQRRDKEIREKMAKELEQTAFWDQSTAHKLARWDPYNPQDSAEFFEPLWMFDRSLAAGFDLVIGNPPYQSAIDHKKTRGGDYREQIKSNYETARGTWDLYIPFFEAALRFSKPKAVISFITPNKFLSATYAKALRKCLPKKCKLLRLTDVSHLPVFESASVYPVISVLSNCPKPEPYSIDLYLPKTRTSRFTIDGYSQSNQHSSSLGRLPDNLWGYLLSQKLDVLELLLDATTDLNAVSTVRATSTAAEADEFGSHLVSAPSEGWKVLNTGMIDPFTNEWNDRPIRHQGTSIDHPILPYCNVPQSRSTYYSSPKIIIAKMALKFEGFLDRDGVYAALNCNSVSSPHHGWSLESLMCVLHSSTVHFAYTQLFDGLRMGGGYLPFQAPQLKCVPIPRIDAWQERVLSTLARLIEMTTHDVTRKQFLDDLTDACVMECYFSQHMAERDLVFSSEVAPDLERFWESESNSQQLKFVETFVESHNEPEAPIRNRLLRIAADSPDLLAVIKGEA